MASIRTLRRRAFSAAGYLRHPVQRAVLRDFYAAVCRICAPQCAVLHLDFEALVQRCGTGLERSFLLSFLRLYRLGDLFEFECEFLPAGGAFDLVCRQEPSKAFLALLLTVRAKDVDPAFE